MGGWAVFVHSTAEHLRYFTHVLFYKYVGPTVQLKSEITY